MHGNLTPWINARNFCLNWNKEQWLYVKLVKWSDSYEEALN